MIFMEDRNGDLRLIPLDLIYISIEASFKAIRDLRRELVGKEWKVLNYAAYLPIKLNRLFPLKKEFWVKSEAKDITPERIHAFILMSNNPLTYLLPVVPRENRKTKWKLAVDFPFSIFTNDTEIEEYMYKSNSVVTPKASSAAIYTLGLPKRLNLLTGQFEKFERTNIVKQKIIS